MKAVFNENAPRGHYSPGMICGNILYVSGQTSVDPATGFPAEGGFEAEMKMALGKMESVLLAAGCKRNSVVMCRIYLPSMELWDRANRVYATIRVKPRVSACKPLCAIFLREPSVVLDFRCESEREPFMGEVKKRDEEWFPECLSR